MRLSVEDGFRLHQALAHGEFRVHVHARFFPFESLTEPGKIIHYAIDKGARAVYCSQEFYDTLQRVTS